MINREQEIKQKIGEILNKKTFGMQDVEMLALCWGALQVFNTNTTPVNVQEKELSDVFPALKLYQSEHTETNLQKLCVEVAEFCRAIYASTQNDNERKIYYSMLEKLKQ